MPDEHPQEESEGSAPAPRRRGSLARHSSTAALASAVAVGTGIVYDAVIAGVFGAGPATDAYVYASRIPLGAQALLTVGANQVLVPLFSQWLTNDGRHETNRRTSHVATAWFLAGLLVAVLGALASPILMRLTAPGLGEHEIAMATSMSRIMFFVIPFEALGDVFEGYLNARYSFVVPSGAKVIRNVVAAVVILTAGLGGQDPAVIAWGYLLGMVLLVGTEVVVAVVRGFRYHPSLDMRAPHVLEAARLSWRPLVGAGINPLARIAEGLFASYLPPGSPTILAYGYRLISAVGGTVFFRSVMITMMPRMSEAATKGNEAEVGRLTRVGVRMMLALSLPLTAYVAVLARPAVTVLFQRGRFSPEDAVLLGWVLAVYALSLPGQGLQRALLAPFYGTLDTRTPLRNTIYGNAFNVALLAVVFGVVGFDSQISVVSVAGAYAVAQYVHCIHADWRLRHVFGIRLRGVGRFAAEMTLASLAIAGLLLAAYEVLGLGETLSRAQLVVRLGAAAALGAVPLAVVFWLVRKRRLVGRA